MKRIINRLLIITLAALFLIPFFVKNVNATKYLDEIQNYEITVDPNFNDGSLDIRIKLQWKVLDSNTEGPLNWVKIGVPNYYVDNIKSYTKNVKKISYYSDNGSFIRLDLDRDYKAGEVLDFDFSFNQSRMYHLSGDEIYYDYNPGYFDDIIVDKCTLRWNATNVKYINNTGFEIIDGYYTYSAKLHYGHTININLRYDKSVFQTIDPKKDYTDSSDPYFWVKILVVGGIILGFFLIRFIILQIKKDPYKTQRGFYVRTYPHWYPYWMGNRYNDRGGVSKKGTPINPPTNVGGGRHGGGGCACACACAGGGRAGCSMKDFYHTNLRIEDTLKALKKEDFD